MISEVLKSNKTLTELHLDVMEKEMEEIMKGKIGNENDMNKTNS